MHSMESLTLGKLDATVDFELRWMKKVLKFRSYYLGSVLQVMLHILESIKFWNQSLDPLRVLTNYTT